MIHGVPPEEARRGDRESLEDRLQRLEVQQQALLAEAHAIREHLLIIGGVLEQVRDRPRFIDLRHPPSSGIGLAAYRLLELVRDPGTAGRFLAGLERRVRETSRRARRAAPAAPWSLHLDRARYARHLAGAFRELMFGTAPAHYEIAYRREAAFPGHRPRILHLIPNLNVGGSTQLVIDLVTHLGRDYEMQAATAYLPASGAPVGLVTHMIPLGSPAATFTHVLDAFRPELVHLHYWGGSDDSWYGEAVAALAAFGAPVVENVNTPVAPLRHPSVSAYVFVSDYVRATFAPDVPMELAHIIHPGIDRALFTPPTPLPDAGDVADTMLMVYRLDRDKLDDAAIDLLIAIARQRPATRILIPGEGELLDVFIQRTQEAGVRANFEFLGLVPFQDLPALYARAGTFIAPVVRESFGQVVPFAMSMGLAVCGNDVGALSEILGGADTLGRIPEETVAKAVALLNDPARRAMLGAANRERSAMFALEGMIRSYEDLYESFVPRLAMPGFPPAEIFR